jgi:hypothetical protein
MKRIKKIFGMVSLILSIGSMASAEWPTTPNEPTVEYSADSIEESTRTEPAPLIGNNFGATQTPPLITYPMQRRMAKVYRAPGKERREVEKNGDMTIQITRMDKHVSWALMPMQKTYIKMTIPVLSPSSGKTELNEVGEEVIDGYQTKKSKLTRTNGKIIFFDGFIWTTPEGIPIKTEGVSVIGENKTQFKHELKNLKIGDQDPSLFEIPEGYTDLGELLRSIYSTNQDERK